MIIENKVLSALDYAVNANGEGENTSSLDISTLGITLSEDFNPDTAGAEEESPEVDEAEADTPDEEVEADEPDEEEEEKSEEEAPAEVAETAIDLDKTYIIDGEKVSGEQLKARLMKDADYTQKTQALATERKRMEVVTSALYETSAVAQIEIMMQNDPDLLVTDADLQYLPPEQRYDALNRRQEAQAYYQGLIEQQSHAVEQVRADLIERGQQALIEALPELKDPAIAERYQSQILSVVGDFGISPDEANQITDHRFALMALELAKYKSREKAVSDVKQKQVAPQKLALKSSTNGKVKPSQIEMERIARNINSLIP